MVSGLRVTVTVSPAQPSPAPAREIINICVVRWPQSSPRPPTASPQSSVWSAWPHWSGLTQVQLQLRGAGASGRGEPGVDTQESYPGDHCIAETETEL